MLLIFPKTPLKAMEESFASTSTRINSYISQKKNFCRRKESAPVIRRRSQTQELTLATTRGVVTEPPLPRVPAEGRPTEASVEKYVLTYQDFLLKSICCWKSTVIESWKLTPHDPFIDFKHSEPSRKDNAEETIIHWDHGYEIRFLKQSVEAGNPAELRKLVVHIPRALLHLLRLFGWDT